MKKSFLIGVLVASVFSGTAFARDQIKVVGSSTVYPFATIVAERFGKNTKFKTPVIESTGSGGGIKLFCSGVGLQYPDVANASRRIKAKELASCTENGVTVTEFIVGNDGLAFANSKEAAQMNVSVAHFAAALAAELPASHGGALVANPNQTWADVDAYVAAYKGAATLGLPATKIRVLVPPPTSGTRDAMGALFMKNGHKALGTYEAVGKKGSERLREDGAAIEVGENDNLIVEKLVADPDLMGVFGFSFFDQNRDKVQASVLDEVELSFDTIADYDYPGARPLYAYLKREHLEVIPGLQKFFKEFISERALGIDGYLFPAGLVPLSDEDFAEQSAKTKKFPALSM